MTLPREIYANALNGWSPYFKEKSSQGKFIDGKMKHERFKYYSQAVLDEKDARIKELKEALEYIASMPESGCNKLEIQTAKEALAGKGGA